MKNNTLKPKEIPKDCRKHLKVIYAQKVIKYGTDKCWGWKDKVQKNRYARLTCNNIRYQAHRISWFIHYDNDPQFLHVLQSWKHIRIPTKKPPIVRRNKYVSNRYSENLN